MKERNWSKLSLVLMYISTFLVYVLCLNLDWDGLLGTMLLSLTTGGFIMNEIRILRKEIKISNKDTKHLE